MRKPHALSASKLRLQRPERAPRGVTISATDRRGISIRGEIHLSGVRLAQVSWNLAGRLTSEKFFDAHGRPHGLERELSERGNVVWQVPWVHGSMHGLARQFDASGRCIMKSRFTRGVGVDVFCGPLGISEFRELANSARNGFERWGAPELPTWEGCFMHGKRHGVFRQWSEERLESGYPVYYLDDQVVTQTRYRAAQRVRTELPRDLRREDARKRARPAFLDDGRVWIRAGRK
jgi:hypothetical protein